MSSVHRPSRYTWMILIKLKLLLLLRKLLVDQVNVHMVVKAFALHLDDANEIETVVAVEKLFVDQRNGHMVVRWVSGGVNL